MHDVTSIGVTLIAILYGFVLATAIGVVLGMLVAQSRYVVAILMPLFDVLQPMSAVMWIPISIVVWPLADMTAGDVAFLGAFLPILVYTAAGMSTVSPAMVRTAKTLGARDFDVFRNVTVPSALPNIFRGLALGMCVAWVAVIATAIVSGDVRYPGVILASLVIGVAGMLCTAAIRGLGKACTPWA